MRCLALVGLSLASATAVAADGVTSQSFDDAWRATVQALAIEGAQITSTDKETGIIQATGSFASHSEWFRCSGGGGILRAQEFTLTAIVWKDAVGTKVQIRTDGKQTWLRNHHVLWIKAGHEWTYITCESTGQLEQRLIARISTT